MHTKYDEHELIEFFRNLPDYLEPEEAGRFICTSTGENNIKIVMYVSIYENKCKVNLDIENSPIFEVSLENVEELLVGEKYETLQIRQNDGNSKDYVIHNSPNFFITTLDNC